MTSAQHDAIQEITFIDNLAIRGREAQFTTMTVNLDKVIQSWKLSLFSFEWLDGNGNIKDFNRLPSKEQVKRQEIEEILSEGSPFPRPVLGLGLSDNIEIGSGRAALLTLASKGYTDISVHIPLSCQKDIENILK